MIFFLYVFSYKKHIILLFPILLPCSNALNIFNGKLKEILFSLSNFIDYLNTKTPMNLDTHWIAIKKPIKVLADIQ